MNPVIHPVAAASGRHEATMSALAPLLMRPPGARQALDGGSPSSSGVPALVFVADADASIRESLDALIRFAGWRTETFASTQAFLDRPPHEGPSCMVLDLDLPHLDGLDLQRRVAAERREMPVICIAGSPDVPVAVQAMKAGAVDFLTKPIRQEDLLHAIDISLSRSQKALDHRADMRSLRQRHATLSRREQEVMALVVQGLLNKQVGGELGISEITVKAHRGSAMRKMKAKSLPELVIMANRLRQASA